MILAWFLYFAATIAETLSYTLFLDAFLECKWDKRKRPLRFLLCYLLIMVVTFSSEWYRENRLFFAIKGIAAFLILTLYALITYRVRLGLALFLSTMDYMLLVSYEFVFIWLGMETKLWASIVPNIVLYSYLVFVYLVQHTLSPIKKYLIGKDSGWLSFIWFPLITLAIDTFFMIEMGIIDEYRWFYSFVSGCLFVLDYIALLYWKKGLYKDDRLKSMELIAARRQDQIRVFHDMQDIYERQGRLSHDHKKKLAVIQGLLENGDTKSAISLLKGLTESISIEGANINTGHPVVSAVLNQGYRTAKSKGIGMIFSICDMKGFAMKDEDIVVLFGNLIENALQECQKVSEQKGKAPAIFIKLNKEEGQICFSIQNPVRKKVETDGDRVIAETKKGHGIGLINVRDVVDRYNGSLILSCTDEEFTAVVLI